MTASIGKLGVWSFIDGEMGPDETLLEVLAPDRSHHSPAGQQNSMPTDQNDTSG